MEKTGLGKKAFSIIGLLIAFQLVFFIFLPIRFSVLLPAYLAYLLFLRFFVKEEWGAMIRVEFFAALPFGFLAASEKLLYKELANDLLVGWIGVLFIGLSFVLRMILLQIRAKEHRAHNLLMIVVFLFMILSVETFLQESRIGLLYKMHNLGRNFVSDKFLLWAPKDLAYNHMSNPSSFVPAAIKNKGDQFRIIFFGGSATAGAELKNRSDSFPFVIEKMLGADKEESNIEVINAGIPSYTTFQIRRLIEMTGEDARADLFVFYVGYNDSMERASPYTQKQIREILYGTPEDISKQSIGFVQRALGRFRTYQLLVKTILPLKESIAAFGALKKTRTVSESEMKENLQALYDFCNSHNITMVLCFEATTGQARRDTWYTLDAFVGSNPDLFYIDVDSAVRMLPDYQKLFFDDVHPTKEGHQVVAKIILDGLLEKGLIPQ